MGRLNSHWHELIALVTRESQVDTSWFALVDTKSKDHIETQRIRTLIEWEKIRPITGKIPPHTYDIMKNDDDGDYNLMSHNYYLKYFRHIIFVLLQKCWN